jgi:hypothetical protein
VAEVAQPRPQSDVGGERGLCLHADEPFDGLGGGVPGRAQEQLAFEQRSVEGVPAEHVSGGHEGSGEQGGPERGGVVVGPAVA